MAVESTATGTTATKPTDPLIGQKTGTESSLSSWAGPYVTDMLGRGWGMADQSYQAYGGPLTAGSSAAESAAFGGIGGLTIPTDQMGAFVPQQFTAEAAQQYMNPYLNAALQPQIDEARRQAEVQRVADAGRLTNAGAFGGSRQAIMESEGNRNLLQNLAGITGTGYANAYNSAMGQFNTEQGRGLEAQTAANTYGLAGLTKQAELGGIERGITQSGMDADRSQFEEERDFPYKQVQYMQSLLQDLPIASQSYSYMQPSELSSLLSGSEGIDKFFKLLLPGSTAPTTPTSGGGGK